MTLQPGTDTFSHWRWLLLWLALLLCSHLPEALAAPLLSADSAPTAHLVKESAASPTLPADTSLPGEGLTPDESRLRSWGIVTASTLVVGVYGNIKWWNDGYSDGFRTVDEGWFGQDTRSGGADKLGHLFTNYVGTRLLVDAFEWAGNDPESAQIWSVCTTLGILTGVEVVDGFSKRWRFSYNDAIMNMLGIGTALLFEKNPTLDRIMDIRLLYKPSREEGFDPFGDYSGQTYLLVAKASGISRLREIPLLRYLELAAGYGTRGFGKGAGGVADDRSRNVYWGAGLNLSELLDQAVYRGTWRHGRMQRFTDALLEYVQIPGTVLLKGERLSRD